MLKFFSLLKASMSQDMQIFIFKSKNVSSKASKLVIPVILFLIVMLSVGTMYAPFAEEFSKNGYTYIILEFAIALPTVLAFMEGIYKSQGILFDAKDNELLLSMPIPKSYVLLSRIIKLYVFQLLYSLLFVLPGIVVYAYYERPGAYFYLITTLMVILFPIIPTVLGSLFGFIIKRISVKFKSKNIVQLIISFIFIALIMISSFNSEGFFNGIINRAQEIDNNLKTYYYPVRAYIELIGKFNIFTALTLLVINIVFVAIFVLFVSKSYYRIISKSKERYHSIKKVKVYTFRRRSKMVALIKKEFARYFSSTIYMINTLFGLLLLLIGTISLCLNFEDAITFVASDDISAEEIHFLLFLAPKMFLAIVIAMSFMTSITSSSISLEGKSFNISKSLPVKVESQLFAKVLMSNIITVPIILVCDLIFFIKFELAIIDIIAILLTSFIAPTIAAAFGLIVNLKYPKMNASSDSEVVKQSMSSMVAVLGGILMAGVFVVITFILAGLSDFGVILEVLILTIILLILWRILVKYGKRKYREIEV